MIEPDDALHNPDEKSEQVDDVSDRLSCSRRGLANLGCLVVLCTGILMLLWVARKSMIIPKPTRFFYSIGYPVLTYIGHGSFDSPFNLGGVNSSGQVNYLSSFLRPLMKNVFRCRQWETSG